MSTRVALIGAGPCGLSQLRASQQAAAEGTDVPEVVCFEVEEFNEWEHHKEEEITTYRNKCFKFAVTGTMAPAHHTPWMQAMDDSIEEHVGPAILMVDQQNWRDTKIADSLVPPSFRPTFEWP